MRRWWRPDCERCSASETVPDRTVGSGQQVAVGPPYIVSPADTMIRQVRKRAQSHGTNNRGGNRIRHPSKQAAFRQHFVGEDDA